MAEKNIVVQIPEELKNLKFTSSELIDYDKIINVKKFYDTCLILDNNDDLTNVVISGKSIEELEIIKVSNNKTEDIKYKARQAVKAIKRDNPDVVIVKQEHYDLLEKYHLEKSNDNIIIACAYSYNNKNPIEFYSEDFLCQLIAKNIFKLTVKSLKESEKTDVYKGFKEDFPTDFELAEFYQDMTNNRYNCLVNEYILIHTKDGTNEIYKWNGNAYVGLFNKNIRSLTFGDKIKPKDEYQRMVIDSLITNTITAISGHAGSGKTLLSLLVAMNLVETGKYDRLVILFNPCPVRGATQMGYYSGSVLEKAMQSNIGQILTAKFGDRYAVDTLISQNKIKLLPMVDCRGTEIGDNEILFISEVENTSIDLLKLCLSRVSSGAKVIIEGDYDQIDSKFFEGNNNGLKRAVEVLKGEKEFGFVELQNVWRSRIAELVDKM